MFSEKRPIDTKTLMELGEDYVNILNEYENLVKNFTKIKESNNFNEIELARIKEAAFKFRLWLAGYNKFIFRNKPYEIEMGYIYDDPISIVDNI